MIKKASKKDRGFASFIYALINPTTAEIFYIGMTDRYLNKRLKSHKAHYNECRLGKRKWVRKYRYIQNMLPVKPKIILLEVIHDASIKAERETYYIKHYRNIYPNLTNMTDGGVGQHTSKYYTAKEKLEYGKKISKANKGRKVKEEVKAYMSKRRMGLGNPAAKELDDWIVIDRTILCKYGFEVNAVFNNKYAYGNVYRYLKRGGENAYNRKIHLFSQIPKEIQELVKSNYSI